MIKKNNKKIIRPKEKPLSCEGGFWCFCLVMFYTSETKKAALLKGDFIKFFYILNLMVLECV